jgi:hypothetical protein
MARIRGTRPRVDETSRVDSSFRQVLKDGPDTCSSESDSEKSDHGEVFQVEDMYTADMIGPDGKLLQDGPARLTAEQVALQRTQAKLSQSSREFLSASSPASQLPTRSVSPYGDPLSQSRAFLSSTDGSSLSSRLNSPEKYPLVPVRNCK